MDIDFSILLAATTAYGATVTKLVDFIRNTVGKKTVDGTKTDRKVPDWVWQACGFGFGVAIAYIFDVNAIADEGDRSLGTLLTGLAIGAAGSGFHELFDALSGTAKAAKASAAGSAMVRAAPN